MEHTTIQAELTGIRPIMFDRYPGDNKTTLEPLDKFYLNQAGQCCVPALNVLSLLAAWNTSSVAKRFYGREGKKIAAGVMGFCDVAAHGDDPMNAVITDADGSPYTPNDSRIQVLTHVARTAQATPNPTSRPTIPTGWRMRFDFTYYENEDLKMPTFRRMIEQGGAIGLGTFRPVFGRYTVQFAS